MGNFGLGFGWWYKINLCCTFIDLWGLVVLNNIHNALCYNRVREAQDSGTVRVGWIPGEHNLAYLLKKTKMIGNTRHGMVDIILYNKSLVIR